jgi:hypothetical protein
MGSSTTSRILLCVVAVLVMASGAVGQVPPPAPTNGLIGYWKFDETAGTTASDSSGRSNTGTLVSGPAWISSGKVNGALSFDGVNDYVSLSSQSLPSAFTLSAWVWAHVAGNDEQTLFSVRNRQFYLSSNVYSFWNNGSAGSSSFGVVPSGSWQHITYTYDGVTLRGFLNAVQSATAVTAAISTGIGIPRIGSHDSGGNYFSGLLDEIRLYNRALSAQEVLAVYVDTGVPPVPDTTPPSTPIGLSASTVSSSRINLSWTASTDDVGVTGYRVYRCQDAGCTLPTQIAAPTIPSYSDTDLMPSTSYTYAVEAHDAANNVSAFSDPASATTSSSTDTVAPTVSLTAPAPGAKVTGTSITISATAADDVGVAGVQFLLDGADLGTEDTASPYSIIWNTTTGASGPHVISARARDAAGNNTVASNIAVTVDNQAPTGNVLINGGAAVTNSRNATLTLSATDALSSVTQMRFSNTGISYSTAEPYGTAKAWTLSTGTGTKTVYVQFKDALGNWSGAFTDTIVYDTSAPTISAVVSSNVTTNSATINWITNEPATSQVEYGPTIAYGNLTTLDPNLVNAHAMPLSGLNAQTLYNYRVRSRDAAGNLRIGTNKTFSTPGSASLTIAVTQTANGTITPGTTAVSPGTNATFTITPDTTFVISSVMVDGVTKTAAATWTDLGTQAGNTRIRAIVNLGGGVAVAGGETMLRSTDNGLTWTNLGPLPGGAGIRELISLGNNIVIAGTNQGSLFRSTNGGVTWTNLGNQFAQTHIYALENLGGGIALAGTQPGGLILRSTDYGATWTNLGRQGTETQIISIENLGGGVVAAGCGINGHILRSTDNGLTWTNLGPQAGEFDIDYITNLGNGIVMASTYPNGKLLRSTDNGLTWTDLGQFDSGGVMSEVVYAGNGLAIGGAGTTGHVWRTLDYGVTWEDLGRLGTDTLLRPAYLDDQVFVVGTGENGKIFRTTNNGFGATGTYTFSNVQAPHTITATYAPATPPPDGP